MQFTKQGCLIKLALRHELQLMGTQACLLLPESLNYMIDVLWHWLFGGMGGEEVGSRGENAHPSNITCMLAKGQLQ